MPSKVGLGSSIGIRSLILGVSLTHPLGFWVLGNRFLVQVNGFSDALLRLANDVNVNIGGKIFFSQRPGN